MSNYPRELTENRHRLECQFLACLYRDLNLVVEYDSIDLDDFVTDEGKFYYTLVVGLSDAGYTTADHITLDAYLEGRDGARRKWDDYGGYESLRDIMDCVNEKNVEGYYNELVRSNILYRLFDQGFNVTKDWAKLSRMTGEEIIDYYEYKLNEIGFKSTCSSKEESLVLDDEFIDECNSGSVVGISYGENCPILNNLTLGLPLGEMFMIGAHSGVGKSSFVFENMVLPIAKNGVKVSIISNEMRAKDYKIMLAAHILYKEMGNNTISRKTFKIGNFTPEQRALISEATKKSEIYNNISFIKLFDNDVGKVMKQIRRQSKIGYQVFIWDTMKSSDSMDEKMFIQLLINSRKVFQLASKENVSIVTTYQLALHTLNQRYLDASCLSNGKQIKEVFSEMIYLRSLWDDEFPGEPHDCQPFRIEGDQTIPVEIDPNKKYIVVFLDKTRNDEDRQQILYEVNYRFNAWKEIGYCKIYNEHTRF